MVPRLQRGKEPYREIKSAAWLIHRRPKFFKASRPCQKNYSGHQCVCAGMTVKELRKIDFINPHGKVCCKTMRMPGGCYELGKGARSVEKGCSARRGAPLRLGV